MLIFAACAGTETRESKDRQDSTIDSGSFESVPLRPCWLPLPNVRRALLTEAHLSSYH